MSARVAVIGRRVGVAIDPLARERVAAMVIPLQIAAVPGIDPRQPLPDWRALIDQVADHSGRVPIGQDLATLAAYQETRTADKREVLVAREVEDTPLPALEAKLRDRLHRFLNLIRLWRAVPARTADRGCFEFGRGDRHILIA